MSRFTAAVRHPMVWLRDVCGGESAYPLVVLFGLNAVDELDRTAFGILLPEIRKSFGIDLQTALALNFGKEPVKADKLKKAIVSSN